MHVMLLRNDVDSFPGWFSGERSTAKDAVHPVDGWAAARMDDGGDAGLRSAAGKVGSVARRWRLRHGSGQFRRRDGGTGGRRQEVLGGGAAGRRAVRGGRRSVVDGPGGTRIAARRHRFSRVHAAGRRHGAGHHHERHQQRSEDTQRAGDRREAAQRRSSTQRGDGDGGGAIRILGRMVDSAPRPVNARRCPERETAPRAAGARGAVGLEEAAAYLLPWRLAAFWKLLDPSGTPPVRKRLPKEMVPFVGS